MDEVLVVVPPTIWYMRFTLKEYASCRSLTRSGGLSIGERG